MFALRLLGSSAAVLGAKRACAAIAWSYTDVVCHTLSVFIVVGKAKLSWILYHSVTSTCFGVSVLASCLCLYCVLELPPAVSAQALNHQSEPSSRCMVQQQHGSKVITTQNSVLCLPQSRHTKLAPKHHLRCSIGTALLRAGNDDNIGWLHRSAAQQSSESSRSTHSTVVRAEN